MGARLGRRSLLNLQHGPALMKKRLRGQVNEAGGPTWGRPVVTPRGEDHDEETEEMPRNEPSHRITDSSMVNEISTLFHGGAEFMGD
jgi:hypothetical protein